MPNNNYRKGYEFERQIVNRNREMGRIAFRSAGSHSPIDVVIIDEQYKTIQLIQCKNTKASHKKLKDEFESMTNGWTVIKQVLEKNKK